MVGRFNERPLQTEHLFKDFSGFPQSWKILEKSGHGNARKKVIEISCPNPPDSVLIVL